MFVEISGEKVQILEEEVSFWMAEFIESWKCPKSYFYHTKGEKTRCASNPQTQSKRILMMGDRRHGTEYGVPFDVLKFWKVNHTIYTLRHKVTEMVEWNEDDTKSN